MKKTYQKPSIKVKEIETESPLATSVDGNTDLEQGNGTPPGSATSKHGIFGFEDKYSVPSSIWDE